MIRKLMCWLGLANEKIFYVNFLFQKEGKTSFGRMFFDADRLDIMSIKHLEHRIRTLLNNNNNFTIVSIVEVVDDNK
jgi:hypothetical protein